jgi:hypothetical protein
MVHIDDAISLTGRLLDKFAAFVERHKALVVLGYSAFLLATCALLSATKLLWYDEMATYYPAKLPTVAAVIDFFQKGLDVHTPVASLVVRGVMDLFGDGPVVDRMPAAIGYLIFCVSLFFFVARRCPAVYGTAAMVFPTLTLMFYYATEMRCYGLVLGLAGTALISWQAATDGKRPMLNAFFLFLSLAAAISCHYYAAFLLVPFGLGELTRAWLRKKIDWPIWAALLVSPLVILIFIPAIRAARAGYVGGMLAVQPHLGQIPGSYISLLSISNAPVLGVIFICLLLGPWLARPEPGRSSDRIPAADWMVAAALALLPVYVIPASLKIGAFNERYILPCVGGVAIFLAFALCRCLKGDRFVPTVLTLVFLAWFAFKNIPDVKRQRIENGGLGIPLGQPLRNASWMRVVEASDLPVAFAPPMLFMQVQQYAPEATKPRIYYVADVDLARQYGDIPSNDTNMLRFSQVLPIQVVEFRGFIAQHPHFLVCMEAAHPNWLIPVLLERGAQIKLLSRADSFFVFDAVLP